MTPAAVIIVSMTRTRNAKAKASRKPSTLPTPRWPLQDAKAHFSDVVRRAHGEGPQLVTLHGHDAVVVVDATEFRRLKGEPRGQMLIEVLQASPHRDIHIEPARVVLPVRGVTL